MIFSSGRLGASRNSLLKRQTANQVWHVMLARPETCYHVSCVVAKRLGLFAGSCFLTQQLHFSVRASALGWVLRFLSWVGVIVPVFRELKKN